MLFEIGASNKAQGDKRVKILITENFYKSNISMFTTLLEGSKRSISFSLISLKIIYFTFCMKDGAFLFNVMQLSQNNRFLFKSLGTEGVIIECFNVTKTQQIV